MDGDIKQSFVFNKRRLAGCFANVMANIASPTASHIEEQSSETSATGSDSESATSIDRVESEMEKLFREDPPNELFENPSENQFKDKEFSFCISNVRGKAEDFDPFTTDKSSDQSSNIKVNKSINSIDNKPLFDILDHLEDVEVPKAIENHKPKLLDILSSDEEIKQNVKTTPTTPTKKKSPQKIKKSSSPKKSPKKLTSGKNTTKRPAKDTKESPKKLNCNVEKHIVKDLSTVPLVPDTTPKKVYNKTKTRTPSPKIVGLFGSNRRSFEKSPEIGSSSNKIDQETSSPQLIDESVPKITANYKFSDDSYSSSRDSSSGSSDVEEKSRTTVNGKVVLAPAKLLLSKEGKHRSKEKTFKKKNADSKNKKRSAAGMLTLIEEEAQTKRLDQEFPGHNWLEKKIMSGDKSYKPPPRRNSNSHLPISAPPQRINTNSRPVAVPKITAKLKAPVSDVTESHSNAAIISDLSVREKTCLQKTEVEKIDESKSNCLLRPAKLNFLTSSELIGEPRVPISSYDDLENKQVKDDYPNDQVTVTVNVDNPISLIKEEIKEPIQEAIQKSPSYSSDSDDVIIIDEIVNHSEISKELVDEPSSPSLVIDESEPIDSIPIEKKSATTTETLPNSDLEIPMAHTEQNMDNSITTPIVSDTTLESPNRPTDILPSPQSNTITKPASPTPTNNYFEPISPPEPMSPEIESIRPSISQEKTSPTRTSVGEIDMSIDKLVTNESKNLDGELTAEVKTQKRAHEDTVISTEKAENAKIVSQPLTPMWGMPNLLSDDFRLNFPTNDILNNEQQLDIEYQLYKSQVDVLDKMAQNCEAERVSYLRLKKEKELTLRLMEMYQKNNESNLLLSKQTSSSPSLEIPEKRAKLSDPITLLQSGFGEKRPITCNVMIHEKKSTQLVPQLHHSPHINQQQTNQRQRHSPENQYVQRISPVYKQIKRTSPSHQQIQHTSQQVQYISPHHQQNQRTSLQHQQRQRTSPQQIQRSSVQHQQIQHISAHHQQTSLPNYQIQQHPTQLHPQLAQHPQQIYQPQHQHLQYPHYSRRPSPYHQPMPNSQVPVTCTGSTAAVQQPYTSQVPSNQIPSHTQHQQSIYQYQPPHSTHSQHQQLMYQQQQQRHAELELQSQKVHWKLPPPYPNKSQHPQAPISERLMPNAKHTSAPMSYYPPVVPTTQSPIVQTQYSNSQYPWTSVYAQPNYLSASSTQSSAPSLHHTPNASTLSHRTQQLPVPQVPNQNRIGQAQLNPKNEYQNRGQIQNLNYESASNSERRQPFWQPTQMPNYSNSAQQRNVDLSVTNQAKTVKKDESLKSSRPVENAVSISEMQLFCFHCRGRAELMCSKCQLVCYCSEKCQIANWHLHEPNCRQYKC